MLDETSTVDPADELDCSLFDFQQIAFYCTRIAASLYQRRIGLTISECNCVTLLHHLGAMSIMDLAERALLDRALASRIATVLATRGLLTRRQNPNDARSVALELTEAGRQMAGDIVEVSCEMSDFLLSALTAGERAILPSILERLASHSRKALAHQRRRIR